jgi:AAA15 family ATPase/GTPase
MVASVLKDAAANVAPFRRMGLGLLRTASIYGANASGKSNVLRALLYMSLAVRNSYRDWTPDGPIPIQPFQLDQASRNNASVFEVDILLNGVRYTYGFRLDSTRVLEEWLYSFPRNRRTLLFKRNGGASPFSFGRTLSGRNRSIRELTRRNSLFLSVAAQNNHKALLPLYNWFTNLGVVYNPKGMLVEFTANLCRDEEVRSTVAKMLSAADLGVTGVSLRKEPFNEKTGRIADAWSHAITGGPVPDDLRNLTRISVLHKGEAGRSIPLPMEHESDGTFSFFSLLGPILGALRNGSVICVDELEASLHPMLAAEIVRLFNDRKTNPRNAQLIFTTQDTNLLDTGLLRRDQVWFTEKDGEGRSHLYPLTDYKPRKNENLERGYLQGRYGAVPFLGSLAG